MDARMPVIDPNSIILDADAECWLPLPAYLLRF